MKVLKLLIVALALMALFEMVSGAKMAISTDELKEAMDEAEDVDDALDDTRHTLKKWGGDYKKILKGMPALKMTDNGISLAGSAGIDGHVVSAKEIASSKELQALAKAENRLAAAKQDIHEAAATKTAVKRAQLEDLGEELTEEAVRQLEVTKEA